MNYQQQLKEHYKAVKARLGMTQSNRAVVPAKAVKPDLKPEPEVFVAPKELPPLNTESAFRPGLLSESAEKKIVEEALSYTALKRYEPFMGGRNRSQSDRFAEELELSPQLPPLPVFDDGGLGKIRWIRILHAVARQHGVSPEEILGVSRRKEIISARFEVFYRLRVEVKMSYQKIAQLMKRDHTSVMHGVYKVRERLLDEITKKRDDSSPVSVNHPLT